MHNGVEEARPGGWPVHRYLLVLALLVAGAGIGAVAYVRGSSIHDAAVAAERNVGFTARLAAEEIDKGIGLLTRTTAGLAANPGLGGLLDSPEACSLEFSGVGVFPRGHLDVIGPDGAVACSSETSQLADGVNYAGETWFRDARREATLQSTTDPSSGDFSLVQAVPSGSGLVVAAFLELDALGPALAEQYGGPRDLEFVIMDDARNRLVSRSVDPSRWTGAAVPGDPWPTGATSFERNDLDGSAKYYGYEQVPDLGWSLYAGADRSDVLAPAQDLVRKTALIIGLGVALTIAALWVVWRRIARPIRSLGRSVRARSETPSDAPDEAGPLEVRELRRDFEALMRSVAHELAERERAEEALRESERTYRLLFEENPEPMWIYDTETLRFLEVNDTACDHYGYSREQFLEMTIKDIRPGEDVPAVLESVEASERVDRSGPWRHVKANEDVIDVEITSHEIVFEGHRGRFVMAHDVTKRLQIERQLKQSQRLESLGQLAGGVAHDFNNLLSVIQNYSVFVGEALERAIPTPELRTAIEDNEQIENAAKRAASLTHSLLTFARQEITHPEVVDPNVIIEEVEKLLRRTIGEEVEFKVGLTVDVWPVRVDPSQLQQVIMNLAVNARDAMPEGGTLTIETINANVDESYASAWSGLRIGRFVRIRVSDTGIGMTPDVAEKVFEPFFTTKEMGRGTGLGLATVHGIVTQAGGTIHVYSEPGMGTAMSVLLPATDEATPSEARGPVRTLAGDETILVVEDEDAIREVMQRMLGRHGYRVIVTESGDEAIAIAEDPSVEIDVVITDVVMPGMMGREITERIAAIRPDTKLIYMSGYAQAVLDSRGRLEAGRTLVEKPFSENDLLTAVRESLDEPGEG